MASINASWRFLIVALVMLAGIYALVPLASMAENPAAPVASPDALNATAWKRLPDGRVALKEKYSFTVAALRGAL